MCASAKVNDKDQPSAKIKPCEKLPLYTVCLYPKIFSKSSSHGSRLCSCFFPFTHLEMARKLMNLFTGQLADQVLHVLKQDVVMRDSTHGHVPIYVLFF